MSRKNIRLGWFRRGNINDIETTRKKNNIIWRKGSTLRAYIYCFPACLHIGHNKAVEPVPPSTLFMLVATHRIITARKEKGWRQHFFHQIEPTVTDPCRTVPCQYHSWGKTDQWTGSQVQCREPKTGLEKVQLYCEDDSHFLSSYYLSIHSPHPTHTRKNTDSTAQRIYIYTEGKAAPYVFNTVNLSFALESRTL